MALRPVSSLGLVDAADLRSPPVDGAGGPDDSERGELALAPAQRARQEPARRRRVRSPRPDEASGDPPSRQARRLGDEPLVFLQLMAPGELHERLADLSYALAAGHRALRHHKLILGSLLWRYVDPGDPVRLAELGEALDEYAATDLAHVPAEIKVGAHVPFSLRYRLEGAVLALRRTRRTVSGKAILSALIWRHARREQLPELVELLTAYSRELQPTIAPLERVVMPEAGPTSGSA